MKRYDVLKVDAVSLLKNTNKQMKTLLHNLNKVVKTQGEDFHRELQEQVPVELEVFDGGLTVNLKISLRERNPPCTVSFEYLKQRETNSTGL